MKKLSLVLLAALALSGSSRAGSEMPPVSAVYLTRGLAEFHVKPEEARVTINGKVIGTSDDWDDAGGGDTYRFKKTGWYWVKFSHPGYATEWVRIEVDPGAREKLAKVKLKLKKR
ncbi:MAG: hypothetical protein JNK60_00355 [Acidobacteria bacterium]|nr:hypothetical protein [Acidobacteriota bacterium]